MSNLMMLIYILCIKQIAVILNSINIYSIKNIQFVLYVHTFFEKYGAGVRGLRNILKIHILPAGKIAIYYT